MAIFGEILQRPDISRSPTGLKSWAEMTVPRWLGRTDVVVRLPEAVRRRAGVAGWLSVVQRRAKNSASSQPAQPARNRRDRPETDKQSTHLLISSFPALVSLSNHL